VDAVREFHPELISRRGERNAWGLAVFTLTAWLALGDQMHALRVWILLLGLVLLISAVAISFSNWIDRKTVLKLQPKAICFRNGLRQVILPWNEIEKLRVTTDRFGRRVFLTGMETYASSPLEQRFNFRLLSQVKWQGQVREKLGFAQGEEILREILDASGLHVEREDESGRYYARP
jgi:hypothetical protein